MKKQLTLAAQVKEAQKIVANWSSEKRASTRLQGTDIYLNRDKHPTGLAASGRQTNK